MVSWDQHNFELRYDNLATFLALGHHIHPKHDMLGPAFLNSAKSLKFDAESLLLSQKKKEGDINEN